MFPIEPSFEESLVERMELDFPVELLEPLLFLLARMTDALLERVKSKARAIALLRVVLRLDGGQADMSASSGPLYHCMTSQRCSSSCNWI